MGAGLEVVQGSRTSVHETRHEDATLTVYGKRVWLVHLTIYADDISEGFFQSE